MYLGNLIKSKKTIFTPGDLEKIWRISDKNYLKTVIGRLLKRGELISIGRGLYCLTNDFNALELANKIKAPSYVSFETVLQKFGIVFQDYGNTVFSASNNTFGKKIAGNNYKYLKLQDAILSNPLGVTEENKVKIASAERALCDRVYLSPGYYFDNPDHLDPEKLAAVAKIYNLRVQKEINQLINLIKDKNA